MKFGIYYAYWEDQWRADYRKYITKVAKLGFDYLEIACTPIVEYSKEQLIELKNMAADNGIFLTAGHGPAPDQNLGSPDRDITKHAKDYFTDLLKRLEIMDIHVICGGLNSYWPVDFTKPFDKAADWARSVKNVRDVGHVAQECGVDYCIEILNRFEGYLCNTAAEGCQFVREVNVPAVKVHLDTFHMNIEEDSMGDAIRNTGNLLGHIHTGEANRRVPGSGRLPWKEIANAVKDIGYDKCITMEPFVRMGGRVGKDISIWRPIIADSSEENLDREAVLALNFERAVFGM